MENNLIDFKCIRIGSMLNDLLGFCPAERVNAFLDLSFTEWISSDEFADLDPDDKVEFVLIYQQMKELFNNLQQFERAEKECKN